MTPADLQRSISIAVIGLAYAGIAHAQTETIAVKVLDVVRNQPVAGSIFMNPGRLSVGKTTDRGEYKFTHKCQIGQTFRAEPADRGKYYNSEEEVCARNVVLVVYPRPQTVLAASDFGFFDASSHGSTKLYVGVFGGVNDKAEQVADAGGNARCKVTFTKSLNVGYLSQTDADWQKLERSKVPAIARAADPDSVYLFQSDCQTARPQIAELKKRTDDEWKSSVSKYYVNNQSDINRAVVQEAPRFAR